MTSSSSSRSNPNRAGLQVRTKIPVDSTPYPVAHLPFANEIELQRFVQDHAQKLFGLTVVSSTQRGGRRLFDIDILAVDSENTPVIIECKWDVVDAGAVRQLAAYRRVLQRNWALFEERVAEIKGRPVRIRQREPLLVVIGYRYDRSVLPGPQLMIPLTYVYHGITLTERLVEQRVSGKVSVQRANEKQVASLRHPKVSKKYATYERLAPLPHDVQAGFWFVDARLCQLKGVRVVYGGKNFVRYSVPRGRFAEARIGPRLIEWRLGHTGELGTAEMLTAADAEGVFSRLRHAYDEAG